MLRVLKRMALLLLALVAAAAAALYVLYFRANTAAADGTARAPCP